MMYALNEDIIHGAPNAGSVSPYIVEFTSMLERCYNYGHTGSAKVIIRRLMDTFWLSLGIKHDGFPCLSPIFRPLLLGTTLSGLEKRLGSSWPSEVATKEPLFASSKAQIFAYGKTHWIVSIFSLQHRHDHSDVQHRSITVTSFSCYMP